MRYGSGVNKDLCALICHHGLNCRTSKIAVELWSGLSDEKEAFHGVWRVSPGFREEEVELDNKSGRDWWESHFGSVF